ncbi:MAG: NAD-dependent epimerase/dehydratase family protein [Candidatus Hodarchaeales archaeon]|jgi:nucleoside-diphosphate-sugar epimerase
MADELHVVLGATGSIGRAVIAELLKKNKKIRGVNRSGKAEYPPEVEMVSADALDDLESLKKAVKGASVVYHCIGLPSYTHWMTKFPTIMQNVIEATAANGPQTKVVFADNLYMYGKESVEKGPLREETPQLAKGKKGMLRSTLAKTLLGVHEQGRIKATIGRGSDIYGPGGKSSILDYFAFNKVAQGKGVSMFADMSKKHAFIYIDDFAKGLVTLATSEKADGEVWHLPHDEALPLRDFITKAYEATDQIPQKIGSSPRVIVTIGGLIIPMLREVKEVSYQFYLDWEVDDSKFVNTFGWKATPTGEGLRETMKWYKEHAE